MKKKTGIILTIFLCATLAMPVLSFSAEEEAKEEEEKGQLTGTITLGVKTIDLDNESSKHGEYTGVVEDGSFAIGDVDVAYVKDLFYLEVKGDDLGLDDRDVELETGRYGGPRLNVSFSQVPHYLSNTSKVIHDGAGSETLTLPSGFTGGASPADMATDLATYRKDYDLRIDRTTMGAGFSIPYQRFSFGMHAKQETKKGEMSIGGVVGSGTGDRRGIVLPETVDYVTDEYTASLSYKGKKSFARLEYHLSRFTNNKDGLTWDNPYSGTNLPATANISLPPDNQLHRYRLSANTRLPNATTVSIMAESGVLKQDETLLDYSTQTQPALPRDSAQAEIATTHYLFNISSRPMPKLRLSGKYKQYKTDNKTPKDLFQYVINDGTTQVASEDALYNLPYDKTQNRATLGATYNVKMGTNVSLGYSNEVIDRTYRAVKKTTENAYKVSLNTRVSSIGTARASYSLANKTVDEYDAAYAYNARHNQTYAITGSNLNFDNNPALRQFDIADRDREKYGLNFNLVPDTTTTLGLYYNYLKDDYSDSVLGLQYNKNQNFTVDLIFTTKETVYYDFNLFEVDFSFTLNAFYTHEDIKTRNVGRYFADPNSVTQIDDATRNWTVQYHDKIPTYGVGTKLGFMEGDFILDFAITYSEATTAITFNAGSGLTTPENMPDIRTEMTRMHVSGKYKLTSAWNVGLEYHYGDYSTNYFSTDNLDPMSGDLAQVITMSGSTPDYTDYTFALFFTYTLGQEDE